MNPELRYKSQKWWSGLSIEEMNKMVHKHYPQIQWVTKNMIPSFVIEMYQKEIC